MYKSALNKAHQQHRHAEAHLNARRFTDAIECHKSAATFLEEALKYASNPKAIDSIKLQIDFHVKQKDIVLLKKQQSEAYKKDYENITKFGKSSDLMQNGVNLKTAIYETMEEADSLLERILSNDEISDSDGIKSIIMTGPETVEKDELDSAPQLIGTKQPKDDRIVIEEFKILNKQLHLLVNQLVSQLESSAEEIKMLRSKVHQLENDKVKSTRSSSACTNNLKVTSDSSGGTSPYVFSPHCEFSPEFLGEQHHSLPSLTPLEAVNFDFANLINSCTDNSLGNFEST